MQTNQTEKKCECYCHISAGNKQYFENAPSPCKHCHPQKENNWEGKMTSMVEFAYNKDNPKYNGKGKPPSMIYEMAEKPWRLWHIQEFISSLLSQAISEEREKYNELILAVSKKYEGETRHETALRYIKNAEQDSEQEKSLINKQE